MFWLGYGFYYGGKKEVIILLVEFSERLGK
jgi:hypothetical protein